MTFKTDSRQSAREPVEECARKPLTERTALFSVAHVEVSIACPYCAERQPSPRDGDEFWQRDDVTETGMGGLVQCRDCKSFFGLPSKLFDIIAGV
jgi:hypothetical protein